jgi:hypothetical protein
MVVVVRGFVFGIPTKLRVYTTSLVTLLLCRALFGTDSVTDGGTERQTETRVKEVLASGVPPKGAVDGHMGASLLHQTHGGVSSWLDLGNNCIQTIPI